MKKEKYNLIDITCLIYIIWVLGVVLIFQNKIKNVSSYLIFYILYALYIVIIKKLYFKMPGNKIVIFLKYFYPILTFLFVYKSIQGYVTVFYGGFLDDIVIRFQDFLFKTQPVLYLERFIHPVVTEIMGFSYFTYYFYVPVSAFFLYFTGRYRDLEYFIFIITLTYCTCCIGFVLFPIYGPRFSLRMYFQVSSLKGYIFAPLMDYIMKHGQTIGACMPSSHLAIAWNALFLMKKFFGKKPFFIFLPVVILMSIAIVYNRYHYLLDAIMGILFAWICYQTGKWLYNKYLQRNRGGVQEV